MTNTQIALAGGLTIQYQNFTTLALSNATLNLGNAPATLRALDLTNNAICHATGSAVALNTMQIDFSSSLEVAAGTLTIGTLADQGDALVDGGGTLMVGTNLTVAGTGAFEVSGTATVTAATLSAGGSIAVDAGGHWTCGPLTNDGIFTVSGGLASAAGISGAGATTVVSNGLLTADYVRQATLHIGFGGLTILRPDGSDAHFSRLGQLIIDGTLNAWTGTLDINDNTLMIDNANTAAANAAYAMVINQIQSASHYDPNAFGGNGGYLWDRPGITSSTTCTAQNVDGRSVMLGVLNNDDGSGHAAFYGEGTDNPLFAGQTPGASSVLLKYTYMGDANLDGIVDGNDYSLWRNAYLHPGQTAGGWMNGDFNYDGVVDGNDYSLWRFNALHPGAQLTVG